MIKKIFSILLIVTLLFILSMNVFCNGWGDRWGNWWNWGQQQNDEPTTSESPSTSPEESSPSPTTETTPEVTTEPPTEPTQTTIIQNDTATSKPIPTNIKKLPKTGETENNMLLVSGLGILAIGGIIGMGYKILCNKK
jgi:LPXTG-motif cell wall-anchored protein